MASPTWSAPFTAHLGSGRVRVMLLVFLFLGLALLSSTISRPPVAGTGREFTAHFAGIGVGLVGVLTGIFGLAASLAVNFPSSLKTARGVFLLAISALGVLMVFYTFAVGFATDSLPVCLIGSVLVMVGLPGFFMRFRHDRPTRKS